MNELLAMQPPAAPKPVRKELRELTRHEWERYAAAIKSWMEGDLGDSYEFPNCKQSAPTDL